MALCPVLAVKCCVCIAWCGAQVGDGKVQHCKVGDAVRDGIVNNETLGYFIARVASFLVAVGIRATHIRFRQHLDAEMAHYASDCWDAEIYTSYGWVEMVGIADRGCFDLDQHAKATNTPMTANETFKTPVQVRTCFCRAPYLGGADIVHGIRSRPRPSVCCASASEQVHVSACEQVHV
jgi:glycyl-tRNA synthetase (class II)